MSFIDLTPIRPGRTPTPPMRIGVNTTWNRARRGTVATLYVCRDLARELKWKPGPMRVQRGEGEDAGKLRLCPAKSGYTLASNGSGRALRLTIPGWQGTAQKPRAAEFTLLDHKTGLVEIIIPDWSQP